MMGSWKSTIGRQLAQQLGWQFVDTDDEIERHMSMTVGDIFRLLGEARFRREEAACLKQVATNTGQVVATGGGIVLDPLNRKLLKNPAVLTVLLRAHPNTLAQRIRNTRKRPLLTGEEDPQTLLEQIWEQRRAYYEETAHYIVDTDQLEPADVVNQLSRYLEEE